MPTLTIRDVPGDITAALDAAVVAAGSRSREAFLRDLLTATFAPENSTTVAIASRARKLVRNAETLGRVGALVPAPTVPRIAQALGHPDASILESEIRGSRPLSFSDGDRLCTLFGIDRLWLESGGQDELRFSTRAKHHDCAQLMADFLTNGVPYAELYFVLSEGDEGEAAIIGHTPSDDPNIGWRYDLLVDNIPIHDTVGGTGRAQRREFVDLIAALHDPKLLDAMLVEEAPLLLGYLTPYAQYAGMISGFLHPSVVVNTSGIGPGQPMTRSSDWFAQVWSHNPEKHTSGFLAARKALMKEFAAEGITTLADHQKAVQKMVQTWGIVPVLKRGES